MADNQDRSFIHSLAKGLSCLASFSRQKPAMYLSEFAKTNQMSLPTARRYLHTLKQLGFIHYDKETKTYQLTAKVLRLGYWVLESMDVKQRLLPFMNSITREFDITTAICVLDGHEALIIERFRSSDVINLDLTAGSRLPIHSTSLGKAIAAFLAPHELEELLSSLEYRSFTPFTKADKAALRQELNQTRQRGYASSDQELNLGLRSMAVPIFNVKHKVEASLGVSYPCHRAEQKGWEEAVLNRITDASRKTSGAPLGDLR